LGLTHVELDIDFFAAASVLVILGVALAAVLGGAALRKLDMTRFPILAVQVQINTVAASLGPEEVEQRITFPIEQAIWRTAGTRGMRSVSKFGFFTGGGDVSRTAPISILPGSW